MPRAIKSLLEPKLPDSSDQRAVNWNETKWMTRSLIMQHGLWKLCGTSVDSDGDKPLLANYSSPLIPFIDSLNSPSSPSAAFNVSLQFCIVLLTTSYVSIIFLAAYSHQVCLHPTIIITFLPHLWSPVTVFMVLFLPTVVFSMAPCNLIWPIKTLAARLLIVQGWGACQVL